MIALPAEEIMLTLSSPAVLILGASTRAAADSAMRSGFRPICLDQFADADLRSVAEVRAISSLALPPICAVLQGLESHPIVFAGGMENHPVTWEALERQHTVWAPSQQAVSVVRDPQALTCGFLELKQPMLELRSRETAPPADGTWMLKPLASAGGRGVRVWDQAALNSDTLRRPHYFQKRIHGPVYSALFIAECDVGDVRFVGLTQQWAGCAELYAHDYWWCGNMGPVTLDVQAEFLVRRWGNILKWKFELTGLFGVDFALDEAGQPWLLEVNPRWTGSAEVLELACGLSLFADHVACYSPEAAATGRSMAPPAGDQDASLVGRGILYAPHRLRWLGDLPVKRCWENQPSIADVPARGTVIESHLPLCSLYARGNSEAVLQQQLFGQARQILQAMTEPVDAPAT